MLWRFLFNNNNIIQTKRSQERSFHHQLERSSPSTCHHARLSHNRSSSTVGCHTRRHNNASSINQPSRHVWSPTQRTWPSSGQSRTLTSRKCLSTWACTTLTQPSTLLVMVPRSFKPANCQISPSDMVREVVSNWPPINVKLSNQSSTATLSTWDWSNETRFPSPFRTC